MRIEDAITNHEWAAMASSGQVAEEHKQQAEWLKELKKRRGITETFYGNEKAALFENKQLKAEIERMRAYERAALSERDQLRAENAKLWEQGPVITGETSDGYHTFNELYHHRAVLFSVIVRDHSELAWKAKAHHDGTMYDGMFIVGIETPQGQATYHYDYDPYWPMFDCKELDRAPEWDGHTPDDAIARIATLARQGDADLKAENDKLRELAMRFANYVGQGGCEGCVIKTRCNEGLIDECWLLTEIREIADELGIEVDA